MLKHVKTTVCPTCGCTEIVGERLDTYAIGDSAPRVSIHCSGERREFRTFLCGYTVEYCPNFSREREKSICPSNKKVKLLRETKDCFSGFGYLAYGMGEFTIKELNSAKQIGEKMALLKSDLDKIKDKYKDK